MAKNKKITIFIIVGIIAIVLGVALFMNFGNSKSGFTSLSLKNSDDLTAMSQQEFYVDVILSDFPENAVYPASSISVGFDKSKVEFLGIRQGNMLVGDENQSEESIISTEWNCNAEVSNQKGEINTMYLDMTASNASYRDYSFENNRDNVLVRLSFKLLDSASSGDTVNLEFKDAVMASVDEDGENSNSLSMIDETLGVKNLKIKVK